MMGHVQAVLGEDKAARERKRAMITTTAWACLWHSKNKLNGDTKHLIYDNRMVQLHRTREDATQHIKATYSWYKRPDLRREPYGWRMPKAVKVEIKVIE